MFGRRGPEPRGACSRGRRCSPRSAMYCGYSANEALISRGPPKAGRFVTDTPFIAWRRGGTGLDDQSDGRSFGRTVTSITRLRAAVRKAGPLDVVTGLSGGRFNIANPNDSAVRLRVRGHASFSAARLGGTWPGRKMVKPVRPITSADTVQRLAEFLWPRWTWDGRRPGGRLLTRSSS